MVTYEYIRENQDKTYYMIHDRIIGYVPLYVVYHDDKRFEFELASEPKMEFDRYNPAHLYDSVCINRPKKYIFKTEMEAIKEVMALLSARVNEIKESSNK